MTQRAYDNIQGLLSYGVLIGGTIGLVFWIDYHQLLGANDLTSFGYTYTPIIWQIFFGLFAVSLIAKAWGAWVYNNFWLKARLADRLHAIAYRIDPRRRG